MQRELASEQELNLKKRARRRLVGAIALVLLMIIVLPIILKDRNSPNAQEKITITLPSEHTQTEQTDFDSSIAPDESVVAPPTTSAEAKPEAKLDTQAKDEVATPQAEPSAAPQAGDAEANTKVENKNVAEKETAKEANKAKDAVKTKFYVQIGVFSDAANVKQLQAKLTDLGYKSQTEKITTDKGQKILLRTQVLGDRNDAAIALQNIKDVGLTGMVVSQ